MYTKSMDNNITDMNEFRRRKKARETTRQENEDRVKGRRIEITEQDRQAMRGQLGNIPAHTTYDSPSKKVINTQSQVGGMHRGYPRPEITDPELTIGFDTDHGRPISGADFH